MHYGFGIVREMIYGLEQYMNEKNFHTVYDFIGKALPNTLTWENLNLKHKVVASINEEKCIGCQLCYTACEDGAHQAIGLPRLKGESDNRVPFIIEENCVGCNLCSLVCPVEDCITMERRDDGIQHETWKERGIACNIPTTFNDERGGGVGHYIPAPSEALKKNEKYKVKR